MDAQPQDGMNVPVTSDSMPSGRSLETVASQLPSTSDSPDAAIAGHDDVDSAEQSAVFRRFKPSWEVDSILKIPGDAGIALLREHVIHESRPYDTAVTNHMIRSAKELAQVDIWPTLETQMKFNTGRYGSPYNPLRPQPASAQVPLKGIVISLLDFLYSQAKQLPATVTRVVKPPVKEPPE